MMLKEHLGAGGFDVACKMVPSLAEVVNGLPQAWQVFLGEFFSYDAHPTPRGYARLAACVSRVIEGFSPAGENPPNEGSR